MGIAYEGTDYAGWQIQVGATTLQAVIETAISKVAKHTVHVVSAGRTDRGVHAVCQIIHFDTDTQRDSVTWVAACNYYLPKAIRVLWTKETTHSFHARFSAVSRSYQYIICQHQVPWLEKYVLYNGSHLNINAMRAATQYFLGQHDFSTLRAASCQAHSPIRQIYDLKIQYKNPWIIITVKANAFLHHMVRNLVGILLEVGEGKRSSNSITTLLQIKDRRQAGKTVSSQGLYLQSIKYPDYFHLPEPIVKSFFCDI